MNSCEQIILRKITTPICKFKIMKLIIDIIVNSTVNNDKNFVLGSLYGN